MHTDVKSKHFHLERRSKQGDPLSTLLFNSLLQYILKQPESRREKTTESNLPDTNLSNLRFADDILLISGSLKHTTTMPDDLTTAATTHGLELHPTKTRIISNTTSNRRRGNSVADQGMNRSFR